MSKEFICKSGQSKQEYNGFLIITTENPISCFIIEEISLGKFKKRREVMGAATKKCDQWGNKLYKRPESLDQLITKAKNFIDNQIVKWSDSPNNRNNK